MSIRPPRDPSRYIKASPVGPCDHETLLNKFRALEFSATNIGSSSLDHVEQDLHRTYKFSYTDFENQGSATV